jgi:RNA polymerase sigma factor (sigma-70 family)
MIANDHELLEQFVRKQSQDAFTALVDRHLNLVYSAALRQVQSPQLAEEISLSAFTRLARHAATLAPDTILTAWLYQVTRHLAVDVIRSEARRQSREKAALQMSAINEPAADWSHIEPLLDEAMQLLDDTSRAAILLRYFENKSLQEVGAAIGVSEDAAQKRVSRAVDRLREFLSKRNVTIGAGGFVALISVHAVQAAPAGLAVAVSTGAVLASATISTTSAVAITKTIAMTTITKSLVAVALTGAVVVGLYQTRQVSKLRAEVQALQQDQSQQTALSNQVQELQREQERATNALAVLADENARLRKNPNEVLKLRGEVGQLKRANAEIAATSPLSKVTANPEARKLMRDQQKAGMSAIYNELTKQLKLTPEQTEKLNDLLADHIMQDVDNVTAVLRDKPAADQMNAIFAAQDAALQRQVEELLGPDGLAKYQDYTQNLLGSITAFQFKNMMTGTDAEKEEKANQLRQALLQAQQAALAASGLPADYQTLPILNFRNIASAQDGEQSLKLMADIYQRAAAQAGAFLSPEDLTKFQEFQAKALSNNRSALLANRSLMAPISN